MLDKLKQDVCEANLTLVKHGLVMLTWGNASAIDPESRQVVIKPSGLDYATMRPDDMVVLDLDGRVLGGALKPSVDAPSHLALYRAWPQIGGVVHTHSHYATCWAQACRPIPCFGTTHADFAYGEIPVTDWLTDSEINDQYESHIAAAILHRYKNLDPMHYPGALVANHAPFTWGATVAAAVQNAVILEEIARMALHTLMLSPGQGPIHQTLLDKHFLRKHGENAYYGQKQPPVNPLMALEGQGQETRPRPETKTGD